MLNVKSKIEQTVRAFLQLLDENELDLEDGLVAWNMLGFTIFQNTYPEENHDEIQQRMADFSKNLFDSGQAILMNSEHFDLIRVTIFRVFRRVSVLLCFWILFSPLLQAAEPAFIRESIRARGMGNAFTAAANDEMLLFYNPAALRSVYYNIYQIVGFNTTTNENTINLGKSSSGFSTIGSLAGKKIYNEINLGLLSHVNSRFGWSFFSNGLLDIQVRNPIIPYLETKAYVQTGLAGGMAWSFLDFQLDLGLGVKLVQRSGIDTKLHIFDEAIIEVHRRSENHKTSKKIR